MKSHLNTPALSSSNKSITASPTGGVHIPDEGDHVLIIGRSVSMLAKAAREAGFKPLVIDAYGDVDTRLAAEAFCRLHYRGMMIDIGRLHADLISLERLYGSAPICWGSGWEASGHLLCALACRYSLLGSSPLALLALARPGWYESQGEGNFAKHDFGLTPTGRQYLVKDRRRAGGHGVGFGSGERFLSAARFRQQFIKGKSISMTCLAGPDGVAVIGWSDHVELQTSPRFLFRHSAVISRMPPPVSESLSHAIERAAKDLRLFGLFGVDFILRNDESLTIVEINPRPTASVPLHLEMGVAFRLHVDPSLWTKVSPVAFPRRLRGAAVVYADIPIRLPKKLNWPTWASDVPSESRVYANGEPLCSIRAEAGSGEAVKRLLNDRLEELLAMFQTKKH